MIKVTEVEPSFEVLLGAYGGTARAKFGVISRKQEYSLVYNAKEIFSYCMQQLI